MFASVEHLRKSATQGTVMVSQEQESEATIHTVSLKLDNRRLERGCLAGWVSISAAAFGWSGQNLVKKHESADPSCSVLRLAAEWLGCDVMGCLFLVLLRPIKDSWVSFSSDHLKVLFLKKAMTLVYWNVTPVTPTPQSLDLTPL